MSLFRSIARRSAVHLTRVAAVLALIALALMGCSVIWPRPLPVILAMSVGHIIFSAALLCYFLAVVLHVAHSRPLPDAVEPPAKS